MKLAWALAMVMLAAPIAPNPPVIQMRPLMGTLWTIEAEGAGAPAAVEAAFQEVHRLDRLLSTYKADSELSRVNRGAGKGWTPVTAETAGLVARALALAEASGGAFDPTVGPLVAAWGFKHLDYRTPSPEALASARQRVGYRHMAIDRVRPAIGLARPGMELDLGAIAKGYAVDRSLAILEKRGMKRVRVDAGGNQGVWALDRTQWTFGVKHPRDEEAILGTIVLAGGAVSTSGDAERGFWQDGVRFGHILDPRSGRPAVGMLSVTVTARTAEEADALSTALYVLGIEQGRALLAKHPGAEALFVEAGAEPGAFRFTATPGLDWRPEVP